MSTFCSVAVWIISLFVFFSVQPVFAVAPAELRLQATPPNVKIGDQFQVDIRTHVGNNNVNIAYVRIPFDPEMLTFVDCTVSSQFQGIFGETPCTVDEDNIVLRLETTQATGPKQEVSLATVTMKANVIGETTLQADGTTQLIVQDGNGRSLEYPITASPEETVRISSKTGSNLLPTGSTVNNTNEFSTFLSEMLSIFRKWGLLGK